MRQQHTPALPMGAGVTLKPEHYAAVLDAAVRPAFFEVHAENYLCAGGPAHRHLGAIRRDSRLSIHGVGLSLGGPEAPRPAQLAARRALLDRYEPDEFSEHLAWSHLGNAHFNDLLPMAYDECALVRTATHIQMLQDALGRRILLENPATYLQFSTSTLDETQFIGEIAATTGCGLLLDVNNIVVNAFNHGFDPLAYVADFPLARVAQIHLAGHRLETTSGDEQVCIDSHDGPVQAQTWSLYQHVIDLCGARPTLIEWDGDLPDWSRLVAEAALVELRLETAGDLRAVAGF